MYMALMTRHATQGGQGTELKAFAAALRQASAQGGAHHPGQAGALRVREQHTHDAAVAAQRRDVEWRLAGRVAQARVRARGQQLGRGRGRAELARGEQRRGGAAVARVHARAQRQQRLRAPRGSRRCASRAAARLIWRQGPAHGRLARCMP